MRTLVIQYFTACVAGPSSHSDRRLADGANESRLPDN